MEGTQWSKLEYATQCRRSFSALIDDFYFLYQNHTNTDDLVRSWIFDADDNEMTYPQIEPTTGYLTQEGFEYRIFNVTGIISGPYQEAFRDCTYFTEALQEKYLQQKN